MTAAASAGGMGLDTATAAAIYGTYTSLVYLMSVPAAGLPIACSDSASRCSTAAS